MEHADLIALFVAPLNRIGVQYMVTGSIASGVYSTARFTSDVDLVLVLSDTDVERLHAEFDSPDFYVPPLEVIHVERERLTHGHFNVIHIPTGFKADFFFAGNSPLIRWALERRRHETDQTGESIWLAPPEYVILSKLQYLRDSGSAKHISDIQEMLKVQSTKIDHSLLLQEIESLGLQNVWQRVTDEEN